VRRPRRLVTGLGLSAAAVVGGVALVTTKGSTTASTARRTAPSAAGPAAYGRGTQVGPSLFGPKAANGSTVRTATTRVGGISETILVNRDGLPLYTYGPDTATASMVSGQLAALWPPLTANGLDARGAPGALAIVPTANGHQVTYNGHFLYTFVEDRPGIVTGQGVQNFAVATPTLLSIGTSPTSSGAAPTTAPSGGIPGY
jgi:predicted lipoprotein with Yx(FWY)xxD motif